MPMTIALPVKEPIKMLITETIPLTGFLATTLSIRKSEEKPNVTSKVSLIGTQDSVMPAPKANPRDMPANHRFLKFISLWLICAPSSYGLSTNLVFLNNDNINFSKSKYIPKYAFIHFLIF